MENLLSEQSPVITVALVVFLMIIREIFSYVKGQRGERATLQKASEYELKAQERYHTVDTKLSQIQSDMNYRWEILEKAMLRMEQDLRSGRQD